MSRLVATGLTARRAARGASAGVTRLREWNAGPPVVAAIVVALLLALALSIGLRTVVHVFDEDLFKQSAVHYAEDGMPHSLLHDIFARGTARLWPLLIAPFFWAFDGDVGVRASHALAALLYVSAAWPAYLLGRLVLRSRWLCAVAAVTAVAAPWLALSTTIYSENLAYPLFLWALLAMWRALDAPSWWRDLLVLGAIFLLAATRMQFGATFVPWVALIAIRELGPRAQWRARWGSWGAARQVLRAYPFTLGILALGALFVLARAATGGLHSDLDRALGGYSEIQDRSLLGQDYSLAIAAEVMALGFGVGVIPAVVGAVWYAKAAAGDLGARAREFAVLALVVSIPTILLTVYAQGGYLQLATEERYFFYSAPLLWIGALAAYESQRIPRRAVWVAGALFVAVVASVDITTELVNGNYAFLAPVHLALGHLIPDLLGWIGDRNEMLGTLAPRDLRVLLAVSGVVIAGLLWRHARGRAVALGLAAIVQIGLTVWAFSALDGRVEGVEGRTGSGWAALAWADRALPKDTRVAWLDNQTVADQRVARDRQLDTTFYNDVVRRTVHVPALNRPELDVTLNGQPASFLSVGRDGHVNIAGGLESPYVIGEGDSPVLQLPGEVVARGPRGGLVLQRLTGEVTARWYVTGLKGDGWVDAGDTARLQLREPGAARVAMTFLGPPNETGSVDVTLGGRTQSVELPGSERRTVVFDTCGPTSGRIVAGQTGPLEPGVTPERPVSANLVAVRITPRDGGC